MDSDIYSMSFLSIVSLVGGSALSTQILAWFVDGWKESRKTKRAATYSALRLAVIMESYALECSNRECDIVTHHSSNGCAGSLFYSLPEIEAFPEDIHWQYLKTNVSSDVLSFPNEISMWNTAVNATWENCACGLDYDGGASWECGEYCAVQGYRAWKIAVRLRQQHNVLPFSFSDGMWDFSEDLESSYNKYIEKKSKEEEALQEPAPPPF